MSQEQSYSTNEQPWSGRMPMWPPPRTQQELDERELKRNPAHIPKPPLEYSAPHYLIGDEPITEEKQTSTQ